MGPECWKEVEGIGVWGGKVGEGFEVFDFLGLVVLVY